MPYSTASTSSDGNGRKIGTSSRRSKDVFGDCALVEIIHLHDCFRGALRALEVDVTELCREISEDSSEAAASSQSTNVSPSRMDRLVDLERRVAGRFTVIWSVFRAHSAAEDEFIWPALKAKQVASPEEVHSPCNSPKHDGSVAGLCLEIIHPGENAVGPQVAAQLQQPRDRAGSITVHCIEQEEYEEDHADEERMFNSINELLSSVREKMTKRRGSLDYAAKKLLQGTGSLMHHLMAHLDKEETHCMPLVVQYLTKAEINDLVGKIMGKRSSELMSQILTMAVQNLNETDRDDMVRYMKQAMVGTFFERWLKMGGWISSSPQNNRGLESSDDEAENPNNKMKQASQDVVSTCRNLKTDELNELTTETNNMGNSRNESTSCNRFRVKSSSAISSEKITSAAELEKLIRAIGTNPNLDTKQKNLTIQGLRDSVWKSNCRMSKRKREEGGDGAMAMAASQSAQTTNVIPRVATVAIRSDVAHVSIGGNSQTHHLSFSSSQNVGTLFRRETPPSSYFKKGDDGEVKLVWSSDPNSKAVMEPNKEIVPLFSSSELAPTYHDGGIHRVLGCPHYARSCKLRHPTSGKLYTCRLCCEQNREMATKDRDSPLDRYKVEEILCMRCGALQPASDKCINPTCESRGKPFARYTCRICNFFDDSPNKAIYHCPFCNVCRSGQGLGIDYRHCMRCNACVSLTDDHKCIPQRLQGNCPICHDAMFESTEPLRGLRCGHVMHLSCFTKYMRGTCYTCPLCKKSAEDMREYFELLDSAVRMQPMPSDYVSTSSNIYCQDCGKMGNVSYHFVGLKCCHCGSYNTRELQRVDANIMANLWQGY